MFHTVRVRSVCLLLIAICAACAARDSADTEVTRAAEASSRSMPSPVPTGLQGAESVGFVVAAEAVTNAEDGRCVLHLWPNLDTLKDERRELLSRGWQSASHDFAESAKTLPFCADTWPSDVLLANTAFSGSGFLVADEDIKGLSLKVKRAYWDTEWRKGIGYELYSPDPEAWKKIPYKVAPELEEVRRFTNQAWFVTAGHVVTQTTPVEGRYEFHGPLLNYSNYTRNMKVIFGLENVTAQDINSSEGTLSLNCDQVFTPTLVVTAKVTLSEDTLTPATDFAVLILDRPLPENRPGLRISQPNAPSKELPTPQTNVRMMGFPFSLVPMQTSEGSIVDTDLNGQWFRYALAATGGFSGSPIVTMQDGTTPLALGVHVVGEALTYRTDANPPDAGFFPLHCLRPGSSNAAWTSRDGQFQGCIHPALPGQERSNLVAANHCGDITQDGQLCFVDDRVFRQALFSGSGDAGCLAFAPVDLRTGLRIAKHSSPGCSPEYYSFYPKATSMQLVKSEIQASALNYLADDIINRP